MKDLKQRLVESLLSADFDEEFDNLMMFEEQLKDKQYWEVSGDYLDKGPTYTIDGNTIYFKGSATVHYTKPGFITPTSAGITKIITDNKFGGIYMVCDWRDESAVIDGNEMCSYIRAKRVRLDATAIKNLTVDGEKITVSAHGLTPTTVIDNVTFNNKYNVIYDNALESSRFKFNGYPVFTLMYLGEEGSYNNTFKNLDNIMQFKRGAKLAHAKRPTRKGAHAVITVANNWDKYRVTNDEMAELIEFPHDVLQMIGIKSVANQIDQFVLANWRHKMVFCKDPKRAEYTKHEVLYTNAPEYTIELTGPNKGWWVIFFKNQMMKDRQLKI